MTPRRKRAIARRLAELELMHGTVRPEDVVRDAADQESVLHDLFEWDDSVAAHKFRIQQARNLIRSVRVEIEVDNRIVDVVAYVHDPEAGSEQGYVRTAKIADDADTARRVLLAEVRRAEGIVERAREVAAVIGLRGDLERLLDGIVGIRRRLAA